jgi:peptidoglycan/LPS O-acetylase OafA/YrhL
MIDLLAIAFAILIWFVLPLMLGGLAIWLPFRTYFRRGRNVALVVGVVNAVFCGFAMLAILATLVFNGYPTFPPYVVIAAGTMAMLAVLALAKDNRKKQRIVVNGPTDSRSV